MIIFFTFFNRSMTGSSPPSLDTPSDFDEPAPEGVFNAFGLLEDLLEHEVFVTFFIGQVIPAGADFNFFLLKTHCSGS